LLNVVIGTSVKKQLSRLLLLLFIKFLEKCL